MSENPPKYHVWEIPPALAVQKERSVKKAKNNGLHHTVTDEVKEWIRVFVKGHWYLTERTTQEDPRGRFKMVRLQIHFREQRDAMAFKLTWL